MHTHAGSTPTLTSLISDTLEPLRGDGEISEAALVPVGMGIVPTAEFGVKGVEGVKDGETKSTVKLKRQRVREGAGGNLSPALFIVLLGHYAISWGATESGWGRQRRRPRMAAALPSSVCMCLSGPTRFTAGLCYSRGDRALEQSMLTGLGLQDLDREA